MGWRKKKKSSSVGGILQKMKKSRKNEKSVNEQSYKTYPPHRGSVSTPRARGGYRLRSNSYDQQEHRVPSYEDFTYEEQPRTRRNRYKCPVNERVNENSYEDTELTDFSILGLDKSKSEDDNDLGCSACNVPSLTTIQEEVTGTYRDLARSLFQVSTACILREHELDGMVDKVRTVEIEPKKKNEGHFFDSRDDEESTHYLSNEDKRSPEEESVLLIPKPTFQNMCMAMPEQDEYTVSSKNSLLSSVEEEEGSTGSTLTNGSADPTLRGRFNNFFVST